MPDIPKIYDINLDAFRAAKQSDLDLLMSFTKSWSRLRDAQKISPEALNQALNDETSRLREITCAASHS